MTRVIIGLTSFKTRYHACLAASILTLFGDITGFVIFPYIAVKIILFSALLIFEIVTLRDLVVTSISIPWIWGLAALQIIAILFGRWGWGFTIKNGLVGTLL